jgi:phenylpropionate dioxygenase-like ring-hydroxylating dioxygenase large terminal subunit/enoyl-CoA hydratase/carnithine racemase
LLMQCHTNGGSLVWDWRAHDQMSDAFADIAGDREIKVLIHTGTGENYNANWGRMPNGDPVEKPDYLLMPGTRGLNKLDEKAWYARHLITNVLDIDVPMISAVNGPCNMHSEVPLLGDIVLASEDAYFQDASHFPRGQVPGDGQHVIWSFLAGHTRARYFLLTGMKLAAAEAKEWGVVNEVLPKDKVLDRAWELARELVKRPPLTLRYSRQLFTNPLKRAFLDELGHGLARETYAQRAFFPFGGEMAPLDRAWDDPTMEYPAQWRSTQRRSALVTSIQQRLSTGRGKFTTDYPELGTAPVNYEDSISEEFFTAEREGVFKRNWLCVGRIERLPRKGSYFTRDLPGRLASIVIARDLDDTVHAFHNVCAHRGNKVVWQEHPGEESSGSCRAFSCKYHGWRYGLDGKVNHITNEGEFFNLDKSSLRMPAVHCEVWAGFIFVHLAPEREGVPVPLRSFLGDGLLPIEGYPFEKMTQHYGFSTRINGNWKLAVDSVCEWYHPPYVHGRFIDPDVARPRGWCLPSTRITTSCSARTCSPRFPGRRHCGPVNLAPRDRPARTSAGSTSCSAQDFSVPTTFLTSDSTTMEPISSTAATSHRGAMTSSGSSRTSRSRSGHAATTSPTPTGRKRSTRTSTMKTRAQNTFHLSDQELLIRQFHTVIRDTVGAYQSANSTREA